MCRESVARATPLGKSDDRVKGLLKDEGSRRMQDTRSHCLRHVGATEAVRSWSRREESGERTRGCPLGIPWEAGGSLQGPLRPCLDTGAVGIILF